MSEPRTDVPSAQDEVVEICRDLIRIDSSNYGDGSGPGERAAAEYVAEKLAEVGLEPAVFESGRPAYQPGGAVRGRGHQPTRPADPRSPRRRPGAGRATGPTTRSPARSPTTACGAAARST